MKLFSAVAACLLSAVVMCGGQTTFQLNPTPVDLENDQLILTRHIWGHFWGGGGMQGGGGGPTGSPPAVTPAAFDLKVPVALAGTAVGSVAATNTPTACSITLGDPNSSYTATPVGNTCALTVNAVGVTKLLTTHTDTLTVRATNSSGVGQATVTVRNWAVPVITPRTFALTAPIAAGTLGNITVSNGPYTAAVGNCGSCVGFFSFTNAGVFSATAAAAAITAGQTRQQTITATNFAGTGTGIITVTTAPAIPVVSAKTASIPFPVPANTTGVLQMTATGNPTTYAITGGACTPACTTLFDITTGGLIRIKTASSFTASTTYSPLVTATNAGGTSAAVAQTITTGAVALPAPVMQSNTYNRAFPVADSTNFGALVATNSPVSFQVASCAGCEGFFTTSGASLVGVAGSNFAASTTYHPVVTATNPTGTSAGVAQNVVIGAPAGFPPIVTAGAYPLPFPTANGNPVGLIATTGGAPTSFNIIGCDPNCTGFFSVPDSTGMMRVLNAAPIVANTTYGPVVTASNAFGTSVGVAQAVLVGTAPLPPPVMAATTYNEPFPVNPAEPIGSLVATNSPQSFAIVSCAGCTGFFDVAGTNLVAVLGTNLAAGTTYNPVITATNPSGTSPGIAQNVIIGPAPLNPPVVSVGNYALNFPTTNGTNVGHINATNTPTSYAITSCTPSCTGAFNNPNSSGNFSVGNAALLAASTVYHPVVTATNAAGTSPGVAQNVTMGAAPPPPPVVEAKTFFVDSTNGVSPGTIVGDIVASNGPITQYSGTTCRIITLNNADCAGGFAVDISTGRITVLGTSSWAPGTTLTFTLVTVASNATGQGSATQTINFGSGAASPPVVTAQPNLRVSAPVTAGVKIAQVVATNAPTSYTIIGCTGSVSCNNFFQVNTNGELSATAAGVANAALNGGTTKSNFTVTIKAANTGGESSALHTINAYADGSVQGPGGVPQFRDLLGSVRTLTAASNPMTPNGHSYNVNDILLVNQGNYTAAAQLKVTSVGTGGAITGINVVNGGSYTRTLPNPIFPTCGSPCSGAGAALNAQYSVPAVSYVARPPWAVAGVDYAVGPPANQVFKIPSATTKPACVTINGTYFNVNASNCVIDGFDFTLNGGWHIVVGCGFSNVVIRNNKFAISSAANADSIITMYGTANCIDAPVTPAQRANSFGSTITNNIIDGGFFASEAIIKNFRGGPTSIFRYNWIRRSYCDMMVTNPAQLGIINNHDIRFNLWEDGMQHPAGEQCHGDLLQTGEDTFGGAAASYVFNFNTFKRTTPFACGSSALCGGQGFILDGNTKAFANAWGLVTATNNTMVARGFNFAQMNFMIGYSPYMSSGATNVVDNYIDAAPVTQGLSNRDPGGPASSPRLTYSGNINMRTGATCNQNVTC